MNRMSYEKHTCSLQRCWNIQEEAYSSMNTAENVVHLTDSIRSFLDRLDTELHTRTKPGMTSFPSDPEQWAQVQHSQHDLFQQYIPLVTEFLDASYASLTELDISLSPQDRQACLAYHRALLQPYFLQSQFVRRALDKPLGYAGDFGVNEMLFDNHVNGISPLSMLLSHYALNNGPARAHRARLPWAHNHLWQRVNSTAEQPFRILSFACGPEHVLRKFVALGGACEITLCDADNRALDYCRREFKKIARKTGTEIPIHYVELSANKLLKDPACKALLQEPVDGQEYDIILVLGLFDYLSAQAANNVLDILVSILKTGGDILLTNVHPDNPWRSFMEYIGDWRVISREEDEFSNLVIGNPPRLEAIELIRDASGTNVYFAGRKC